MSCKWLGKGGIACLCPMDDMWAYNHNLWRCADIQAAGHCPTEAHP